MHTRQGAAKPAQPKHTPADSIHTVRQFPAPNWAPLEKLLPPAGCSRFMFMGTVVGIYLYKHIDTRRYLNVDEAGATYAFNPATSNYDPIPLATALSHAVQL